MYISSPIAALYALAASTFAGIAALYFGMDSQSVAFPFVAASMLGLLMQKLFRAASGK